MKSNDFLLDRIELLLLRISDDDQYKSSLTGEYNRYRNILECLPKDADIPQRLYRSVFSLEQRLKNYVLVGITSDPTVETWPMLSKKIENENETSELLKSLNSNKSYINNRKSKLTVLFACLQEISLDKSVEEIKSSIEFVENEYNKTNVYSNELEKAIANAKYSYMLKMIYSGYIDEAKEYAQSFSTDMVLIIYEKHIHSVSKLINMKKPMLAKAINDFITELPEDIEKDIEFWKILAQIENPDYTEKKQVVVVSNTPAETRVEKSETTNNRFSFMKLFRKNTGLNIERKTRAFSIKIGTDGIIIKLELYHDLYMNVKDLDKLITIIENEYSKNKSSIIKNGDIKSKDAFSNILIIANEHEKEANGAVVKYVTFKTVIEKISGYGLISNIKIYSDYYEHSKHICIPGFLSNCMFERIEIIGGGWIFYEGAFEKCILLEEVDFSRANYIKLGPYAFADCKALKRASFPDDACVCEGVFYNCISLEEVIGYPVCARIRKKMFMNCKLLKTIPDVCVEIVEESAFEGCESLENFSSSEVTRIEKRAFFGCKSLKKFIFFNECAVGELAFANSGLEDLNIKTGINGIGVGAFSGSAIRKARFDGNFEVPQEMFKDCKMLQEVTLGVNMGYFRKGAFSGCSSLTSIDVKYKVFSIGDECFYGCTELKELDIAEKADLIGQRSFMDCSSLMKIMIPKDVEAIQKESFKGCSWLSEVDFSQDNAVLRIEASAFEGCRRLKTIILPPRLRAIKEDAFRNSDIHIIEIPDSVYDIEEGAFANCTFLKRFVFPPNVREIKYWTFGGCYNLVEVDISKCEIVKIDPEAFSECNSLRKIIVGNNDRVIPKSLRKFMV